MKKHFNLILLMLFISLFVTNAQELNNSKIYLKDSIKVKSNRYFKKSIVPVSLIGVGLFLNNSKFEKSFQKDIRNSVGNNFNFPIDNYLRYAPILEMYIADISGVKAKNHWFNQTKNLTIAIIISDFITYKLKKSIRKRRPNGDDILESFPSGHTSFAFTNASVLFEEYKQTEPWLAYSGYAFAATTGAFRVMNNAHWVSDVLVSAGIGILVTKLVYYFEPLKKFNPFKKTDKITFLPKVTSNSYGFYLAYSL